MKRNLLTLTFLLVLATAVTYAQAPTNSQPNPQQSVPGQTSHSETQNNTAGSISGNASPTNTTPTAEPQKNPAAPPASAPGTTADPTQPTIDKEAQPQGSLGTSGAATTGATTTGVTDSATLKGQLESAFQAEPTLTGSSIQVNVTDSNVELTGSVPTPKEKTTARRIAQSYAGNRKVIDKMTVSGRGNSANPK